MLFTYKNLITAYHSCHQHKRHTVNALNFKHQLFKNIIKLKDNLSAHCYQPGQSVCFAVSYPKLREIFAADFRDRVVHHLLVNQLEPHYEKRFIFHSFACRKNKGGHLATRYLAKYLRKLTSNYTHAGFYLQLDISNFFARINKFVLIKLLEDHITHRYNHHPDKLKQLLWLTRVIVNHNPTTNYHLNGSLELHAKIPMQKSLFSQPSNRGLAIGNLTSQFFANVYLDQLDQFCKRQLNIKFYFRYADDVVMLHQDKEQLLFWKKQIQHFLHEKLSLELNPTKTKLHSVYQGINFVGYVVKPHRIYVRNKSVNQVKTILHYFNQGISWVHNHQRQEAIPLKKDLTIKQAMYLQAALNSYYAHFRQASSYRLRKHLYQEHFGKLKKYLKPVNKYHHFVINPSFKRK